MEKATEREDNKKRISFLLKFIRRKKEKIPLQKKKTGSNSPEPVTFWQKAFPSLLKKSRKETAGASQTTAGGGDPLGL